MVSPMWVSRLNRVPWSGAPLLSKLQDLGGDQRLVLAMANADQLQPAGAERELIVAVDVG